MAGRRGVKIPYSPVKNGRRFWQPTPEMQRAGFQAKPLGAEGPASQAEALRLYQRWLDHRSGIEAPAEIRGGSKGETAEVARRWPMGSIGAAYVEYMRTPEWGRVASSTRNRDRLPSWAYIRDAWGDCDPNRMTLSLLSDWRAEIVASKGEGVAHKVFKEWRRHWKVMTALRYVSLSDPSLGITNTDAKPRWQTWQEGEIVRIVKAAIRADDMRLAATIAVIWDTQFQPGDARTLRAKHVRLAKIGGTSRYIIDKAEDGREKTGRAVIGTLGARAHRVLDAYLKTRPAMTPEAWVFPLSTGRVPSIPELSKQFRALVETIFPGDKRQLRDMRRTGAVESFAGGASAADVGNKMANSIGQSNKLFRTYNPVDLASVRRVDEARIEGRKRRRDANE